MLKAALFVVMTVSLGLMWNNRAFVVDAYRLDSEGPAELRLSGVNLDFEKTELEPSPYVVHTGVDTRRRPMSLLFTATEVDAVSMIGGEARIGGSVRVDGRPATGAVVRLERHTTDGVGIKDVIVGGNGRFSAWNLPGGRYRVRAWSPGQGSMTTSDVFFLDADGSVSRSYNLEPINPEPRVEFVNGGTMTVGLTGTLGVIISREDVDIDGRRSTVAVSGAAVSAQFSSHVTLLSGSVVATGADGLAQFRMRCLRAGTGQATITVGDDATVVALAPCVPAPTPARPAPGNGNGGGGDGSGSDSGGSGPVTTTRSGFDPATGGGSTSTSNGGSSGGQGGGDGG